MKPENLHPRDWKEGRRKRALELKQLGWKQREIAGALGVSKAAVSKWVAVARENGTESWRATPRPGGPPKLTREQMHLVPDLLSHGVEADGFRGDVWICARVAVVIRREFGVSYHKAHVSRILKKLGWTPQMPIERAVQRDEARIEQWRLEVWPEVKKRHSWADSL
jgi:transposase